MNKNPDLTQQETHFAFGKNWASYAESVGEPQLEQARRGLAHLLGPSLHNKRFVDIGCGSGVHALAALSLGATEVVAIDIDPDSVATTRALLEARAAASTWSAHHASIFELDYTMLGDFDVVYSWGVLHHTGDLNRAIRCAAKLVRPGGDFALALYRKTLFCKLWKAEKKWYTGADTHWQRRAERVYIEAFRVGLAASGRSLSEYVANYQKQRGMDFYHDVRDWLGGWPYESITAQEVDRLVKPLGFTRTQMFGRPGVGVGMFGVGCNEYVYNRSTEPTL